MRFCSTILHQRVDCSIAYCWGAAGSGFQVAASDVVVSWCHEGFTSCFVVVGLVLRLFLFHVSLCAESSCLFVSLILAW